jgi:hypothetical protein
MTERSVSVELTIGIDENEGSLIQLDKSEE